ncbi:MAG: GNAT family N-acetyltransferase, partial [Methyloceanibacter sp.]
MKPTSGRLTAKFRGGAMFPGLNFEPGQGAGLPFMGRRFPSNGLRGRFQPPKIYGRIGQLEVRLARKKSDVRRAQRLRYKVFYEEMSAIPDALTLLSRRDEDAYDPIYDHLLVLDHGDPAKKKGRWRRPHVVGTYRVLRQDVAELHNGFYTQSEYDIAPLIEAKSDHHFIELGRS